MNDKGRWRASELGAPRQVSTRAGAITAFEAGDGPPVVFVHGLLVNANLWRKVVPRVADSARTIVLDLPLGSHEHPVAPAADLSPPGLADLIADALETLELEDVTLVGNDTGGALCQILVTRRPERVGRLVLTSCDYRDNFPPRVFSYLAPAARVPGAIQAALAPLRLNAPRRLPIAFGWIAKRPIERRAADSYLYPAMTDAGVRHDLRKVIRTIDTRHTNEAADRLGGFAKPALVAWSADDKLFPRSDAERLAADLHAPIEWIEDSYTFSAEDRPERVAQAISGFVRKSAPASV